jgi:REP element-mobilizing transposase RayT/CheY-like chemotaxis protein
MVTEVLIASPTIAFGELIRLTLEGDGNYRATRVDTGCEALARCQINKFALAILDADLNDLSLPDLFTTAQKLCPGIRLIVVPPNSDPKSPLIAGLPYYGILNKPFYLPDLMNIVTHVLSLQEQPPKAQAARGSLDVPTRPTAPKTPFPAAAGAPQQEPETRPVSPSAPDWLQDVARAAQHLTSLSLETSALAAMIIREGKLWAYAGQLSQPAVQELAQTVVHYWERGNGSDLARFIHLDATAGDYMLYATAVSKDLALAMVFDIEMPFSKIRSQASHLRRSLTSPPGSVTQPPQEKALLPAPAPGGSEHPEGEETIDVANLRPLFDDVPTPAPGQGPRPLASASPDRMLPSPAPSTQVGAGEVRVQHSTPAAGPQTETAAQPVPVDTVAGAAIAGAAEADAVAVDSLEPGSPAVFHLSYACLLIPRMPQHALEGDLFESLTGWTRQLCLAFGWRLNQLVIHPDHVEWVMNAPPTTSPSRMMRIFRQQTSASIFADFPALARDNPSGDFWAPGYLVMSSGQLPPESVAKDFILQTRRRQGVSHPLFLP